MGKKRKNDLNDKVFEEARQRVEAAFPHQGVKKGFYITDFKGASVLGGIAKVAVSAVVNIVGDTLNLRTYRLPKEEGSEVRYKVDELRGINKPTVEQLRGPEVPNHHIKHDVPQDMMEHNNITVEVVYDGAGGLKPNVRPDGMVNVYINFPEITPEEMIRRHQERKRKEAESESKPKEEV